MTMSMSASNYYLLTQALGAVILEFTLANDFSVKEVMTAEE